jgi:hypothetical protein
MNKVDDARRLIFNIQTSQQPYCLRINSGEKSSDIPD